MIDACTLVDALTWRERADAAREALDGKDLHAPAHLDQEVMSALARMQRAGKLSATEADRAIRALPKVPATRHPLPPLIAGAWGRRTSLRVSDALYVELAEHLGCPLITSDQRLARAYPEATLVS